MTYHSYNSYKTFEFTAFTEAEILGDNNGCSIGCGDVFEMPVANTCIEVSDNDRYLSGDACKNEKGDDRSGQNATITVDGEEVTSNNKIYAEQYHILHGSDGNTYYMIEIEQRWGNAPGEGDDYFTFYGDVPPVGVELTVVGSCNVKGNWVDYKCLDAGDKTPPPGSISGLVFSDDDCDGLHDQEQCVFGENLIKNGDFEDNALCNNGKIWNASSSQVADWNMEGCQTADLLETDIGHGNATGNAVIELDKGAIVSQDVDVSEGGTYQFSFDLLERSGVSAGDNTVQVFIDGQLFETVVADGQSTFSFEIELAAGEHSIEFVSCSSSCYGAALDNVALQKKTVVPGEDGIEGVTVYLLDVDGNQILDDQGQPVSTVTDADGKYSFAEVPPGDYRVFVDSEGTGKVPTIQNAGSDDTIDSDINADGISDVFTVLSGLETKDIDAGLEDCTPQLGSLSGKYFCDDNNNDIDDDSTSTQSNGIAGVTVQLLDAAGNEIAGATTTTDAEGKYSFDDLAAGTYGVKFIYTGGKTLVDANQGTDDAIDSDAIDQGNGVSTIQGIEVVAGQNTPDNDAGVEDPGTASLAGRVFCDSNDDSLDLDANGNAETGVENVTVNLLDADGNVIATTETDAQGNYEFTGLKAGTYSVDFDENDVDLGGKVLVTQDVDGNVNDVDDSDASETEGTTAQVTLAIGERVEDIDAGVEDPGTASLAGRVFCDSNDDSLDLDANGNAETGVENVTVNLLDADGNVIATTETDDQGNYEFTGLDAGTYSVDFDENDTDLGGKVLVTQDVDGNVNDVDDSDASEADGTTAQVTLAIGERVENIDMGVENTAPEALDDSAMTCYDVAASVDVLENDTDAQNDNLTITAVNGIAIAEGGAPINVGGVLVSLVGGELVFDGSAAYADLISGQHETATYAYTVEDGNGGSATANVDVTFCGATDTLEKIAATLPATVQLQVEAQAVENGPLTAEGLNLTLTSTDDRLDGFYEDTFCMAAFIEIDSAIIGTPLSDIPVIEASVMLADKATLEANGVDLGVGINGESGLDNLDLVNWILNQDFDSQDNGDGTGENYTDAEIQGAIWALTDGEGLTELGNFPGFELIDGVLVNDGAGTTDNANEIIDLALASGEGFEAQAGDVVGVFLNPTTDPAQQPLIIGIELFEECTC